MHLPPDLTRMTVAITTSATPNTVATTALIATPGPGRSIRLWVWKIHCSNSVQAVVNWRLAVRNATSGGAIDGVSSSNFTAPVPSWFPGGYQLGANIAVDCSHSSALASLVLSLELYYTLEDV